MKFFSKLGFASVILFLCCTNGSLWSMKQQLKELGKLQFHSVASALAILEAQEFFGCGDGLDEESVSENEKMDEGGVDQCMEEPAEDDVVAESAAENQMLWVRFVLREESIAFATSILYLMGIRNPYDTTHELGTIFETLPTDNWRQLSKLCKQLFLLNEELDELQHQECVVEYIVGHLNTSTCKSILMCFDCLDWLLWVNNGVHLSQPRLFESFSSLRNSCLREGSTLETCLDTLFNYVALLRRQLAVHNQRRNFLNDDDSNKVSNSSDMPDVSASDKEDISEAEGCDFDAFAQKDGNGKEYLKRVCKHQKLTRRRRSDYMAK